MPTHIWLLHPGGPSKEKNKRAFFEEQLLDPLVLNSIPAFLKPIWIWFLLYFRMKTPLLTGSCSSFSQADEQAAELSRLLGSDFSCHTIHRYSSDSLNVALHKTPSKSFVILLPLIPHRCSTLASVLEKSRSALRAKKNKILEVGSYSTNPLFIESITSLIRSAIIDLDGRKDYAILFIIEKQPENWNKAPKDYYNDAHKSYVQITASLNSTQPHSLHYPHSKTLRKTLQNWHKTGIRALITVPLSWVCPSQSLTEQVEEEPKQLAREIGFDLVRSSSPAMKSPVFYHFLVETILDLQEKIESE